MDRQLPEHQSGGRGLRIHFQLVSLEEVDHKGRGEPAQTDGWTHRRTDGRTDSLPERQSGGPGLQIHSPRASLVEVGRKNRGGQTDRRTDGQFTWASSGRSGSPNSLPAGESGGGWS